MSTNESTADPEIPSLSRESVRALHEQLSDQLLTHLLARHEVGKRLPTEEELTRAYGVSRVTVRRAIQTLVSQGMLIRRQGKGTFIARPKPQIVHPINRLAPFVETFMASGEEVETTLLDFTWIEGSDVPPVFRDAGGSALTYSRLYVSSGTPHAVTRIVLPEPLGEKVSRSDASSRPIYDILRKKLRVVLSRADLIVSSQVPDARLARVLGVSPSTSLLVIERTSYDADENPVETTTHYLRPDVYKLSVSVSAEDSPVGDIRFPSSGKRAAGRSKAESRRE